MTQAWGLEAGIPVPAWLWGPRLLYPSLKKGYVGQCSPTHCPTSEVQRLGGLGS